ncbi:hypothetical protein [Actinoplanes xinjiangensis]|uniref:hypothetical protein n=1 Tax=Actinoplanes xinjiangensis TaxID=512350 RepID=UPI00341D9FAD
MSGETFVSLADLRRAVSRVLDEVERQPTVGQLADDIQSMYDMLADREDHSIAARHDLAHLIGILNGLAALDLKP